MLVKSLACWVCFLVGPCTWEPGQGVPGCRGGLRPFLLCSCSCLVFKRLPQEWSYLSFHLFTCTMGFAPIKWTCTALFRPWQLTDRAILANRQPQEKKNGVRARRQVQVQAPMHGLRRQPHYGWQSLIDSWEARAQIGWGDGWRLISELERVPKTLLGFYACTRGRSIFPGNFCWRGRPYRSSSQGRGSCSSTHWDRGQRNCSRSRWSFRSTGASSHSFVARKGQDLLHPLRDTMFLIQHCSQGWWRATTTSWPWSLAGKTRPSAIWSEEGGVRESLCRHYGDLGVYLHQVWSGLVDWEPSNFVPLGSPDYESASSAGQISQIRARYVPLRLSPFEADSSPVL